MSKEELLDSNADSSAILVNIDHIEGNYDIEQMVIDLTKLSGEVGDIWNDYPFERYVYMVPHY